MGNGRIRNAHFHLCIKEPSTTSVPWLIMKCHGVPLRLMKVIITSLENGEIVILSVKQVIVIYSSKEPMDLLFTIYTFQLGNNMLEHINLYFCFILMFFFLFLSLASKKIAPQVIFLWFRHTNINSYTLDLLRTFLQ